MPRPTPAARPGRSPAWRALCWLSIALIAATLVADRIAAGPSMTGSLAILLAASLAALRLDRKLPDLFVFLVVFAALASAAGGAFAWFEGIAWYDEAVHFYTGFAGLAAIGHVWARDHPRRWRALPWWCAGMGLVLGAGWEVIEGIGGDLGFGDTVSDLLLDVAGAAAGGAFARRTLQRAR